MSRASTSPSLTWCCHTTPLVSTTTRTTLPRKHGPHGKPPSAGTPAEPTTSRSSDSPKFERSEQQLNTRSHLRQRSTIRPVDVFVPRDFDVPRRLETPEFVLEP